MAKNKRFYKKNGLNNTASARHILKFDKIFAYLVCGLGFAVIIISYNTIDFKTYGYLDYQPQLEDLLDYDYDNSFLLQKRLIVLMLFLAPFVNKLASMGASLDKLFFASFVSFVWYLVFFSVFMIYYPKSKKISSKVKYFYPNNDTKPMKELAWISPLALSFLIGTAFEEYYSRKEHMTIFIYKYMLESEIFILIAGLFGVFIFMECSFVLCQVIAYNKSNLQSQKINKSKSKK